jgi:hypothetical protein
MPLFLVGIFILSFFRHLLDKSMVVSLASVFVLKYIFLLKDAFHHLSGNALVLLVVVGRARVV